MTTVCSILAVSYSGRPSTLTDGTFRCVDCGGTTIPEGRTNWVHPISNDNDAGPRGGRRDVVQYFQASGSTRFALIVLVGKVLPQKVRR